MIILGIDVGGSTTKIVGLNGAVMLGALQVRAADQVTSLYGALGRFLSENSLALSDIAKIVLTGVGASFFGTEIYGIPTSKADEFESIGYGGLRLSGLSQAVVVSVGTGSAFVRATETGVTRIGGSGVGGGTLMGLSQLLLEEIDIGRVSKLADNGTANNVDLLVGDISAVDIPSLPKHATAANFGAVNPTTAREDIALGITRLVTEAVGMLAVFATLNDPDNIKDVVVVGSAAKLPKMSETVNAIHDLTGIRFTIPHNAEFATALGAIHHAELGKIQ